MKVVLIFCFLSLSAFAQLQKVSVLSEDMKDITCAPSELELDSRAGYVDKMLKKGFYAKSLLPYSIFKKEHLRDILRSIDLLPAWLKLTSNSDWKHIRVIYRPNLNSVANAFITIGPKWLELDSLHRQAVLVHELFHRLSTRMGDLAYSKKWIEASESWNYAIWQGRRWRLEALDERNFVSSYAMTNPSEDFAETLTLYRVNPKKLMDINFLKYTFIKENIFFGQEFLDDTKCEEIPNFLTLNSMDLERKITLYVTNNYSKLKKEMKKIKNLKRVLLNNYTKNYQMKVFLETANDLEFLSQTKLYKRFIK